MPGMAEEIEGAMQQAPHPGRQFIGSAPPDFPADATPFGFLFMATRLMYGRRDISHCGSWISDSFSFVPELYQI
jgi:hypothetical protein